MMEKLLAIILMLTGIPVQATWNANNVSYTQFAAVSQQMASHILKNSEEAEFTLDLNYRTATPEFYLHYVNRITQNHTSEGIFQHNYQYLCRKTRKQIRSVNASTSLCGEMTYKIGYRPKTKKALY